MTTNRENGIDALVGSSTPWSVDYGRITPLLAKSIQDLNLKLEDLTTTTSKFANDNLITRFFASLFIRLTTWFANAANCIGDFYARRVRTQNCAPTISASREINLLRSSEVTQQPPALHILERRKRRAAHPRRLLK